MRNLDHCFAAHPFAPHAKIRRYVNDSMRAITKKKKKKQLSLSRFCTLVSALCVFILL